MGKSKSVVADEKLATVESENKVSEEVVEEEVKSEESAPVAAESDPTETESAEAKVETEETTVEEPIEGTTHEEKPEDTISEDKKEHSESLSHIQELIKNRRSGTSSLKEEILKRKGISSPGRRISVLEQLKLRKK